MKELKIAKHQIFYTTKVIMVFYLIFIAFMSAIIVITTSSKDVRWT